MAPGKDIASSSFLIAAVAARVITPNSQIRSNAPAGVGDLTRCCLTHRRDHGRIFAAAILCATLQEVYMIAPILPAAETAMAIAHTRWAVGVASKSCIRGHDN